MACLPDAHGPYSGRMDGTPPTAGAAVGEAPRLKPADPEAAATLAAFANLDYRDRFWPGRRYEDQCDRIALRAMLPAAGRRLLDVGAGFGRLADEYTAYPEVVLLDPSPTMLDAARERLAGNPRHSFLPGDAQRIPLPDGSVDVVVCVRVLHHFADPRPAFMEFARVLRPGGVLVLESTNKRNLKSILAYVLRRVRSSPFSRGSQPYTDVTLIPRPGRVRGEASDGRRDAEAPRWRSATGYLHAPADLRSWLRAAGLDVARTRSVGLLRPRLLTAHLPLGVLTALERVLQPALASVTPGPSLFIAAARRPGPARGPDGGHPGGDP